MKLKVFLDLDGVLVDWSSGLCKLLKIDRYAPEAQAILRSSSAIQGWKFGSLQDVDNAVNKAGYNFWMNLELLPWAYKLIALVEEHADLYFLTSPSNFPAAAHAKVDYINQRFGRKKYIITEHKYVCSRENCVLIDDMQKNIDEWSQGDGLVFHWPCQWSLKEDPKLLECTLNLLEFQLKQQANSIKKSL